jgi:flagellar basal-body rod protein FlgF
MVSAYSRQIFKQPKKEFVMDSTLYIAMSHQAAIQRRMDVVANNIANMNTTAFQKESVMFQEYLVDLQGVDSPVGNEVSFTRDYGVALDFRPGDLQPTNNPLDVAINGPGYFSVQTASGETLYTRNGHFSISETGELITSNGDLVLDNAGATIFITAQDLNIEISESGSITSNLGPIATLSLNEFADRSSLEKVGNALYRSSAAPIAPTESMVAQGMLETSNVKAVEEMTEMLQVLRSYQSIASLLDKYQNMRSRSISALGKVG